MKREGTIGAAAFLAIAAAVGISLQTGPKPAETSSAVQNSAAKRSKKAPTTGEAFELKPGCGSLKEQLEDFLEIQNLLLPENCYEKNDPALKQPSQDLTDRTSSLKFVIALLPDPVHTHLPVLFDQFAVAIQEGAQDEKYDFDGSWLPWDDQDPPYALFLDEKAAGRERELKEDQPGIILFRKTVDCGSKDSKEKKDQDKQKECKKDWEKGGLQKPYSEGLVVFVVGEEATHGIHSDQFRNALAWMDALQVKIDPRGKRVAILGPTFSGSLPSLTQVFSVQTIKKQLGLRLTSQTEVKQAATGETPDVPRLAVYSGSVSGKDSAHAFQDPAAKEIVFHSFVQNDYQLLERFCEFIEKEQKFGFDLRRIATISEDETAYGGSGVGQGGSAKDQAVCDDKILKLYYPRDISALRDAYQTKSLFAGGASSQSPDTQRRSLPTDLADPSGKVHDSIRNYGGNQTPLTQEAFLMDLVAALREFHVRYIFLRSSNPLDQLFLTNFLRRSYPDGRIVIFDSDLMLIRERGATGLSGSMTLSTYPLFPLEHRWTDQMLAGADRIFGSNGTEGTYVAFRLLLNDKSLNKGAWDTHRCHVLADEDEEIIFLPPVVCGTDTTPIPDYAPPFWTMPASDWCDEKSPQSPGEVCRYPGPAIWLSVIGENRFWPVASLTPHGAFTERVSQEVVKTASPVSSGDGRELEPGGTPEIPLEMKVFLLALVGFSLFHVCCCWFGSYTSKPAFRAHFASPGDLSHASMTLGGSCCVAFLAVVAGWGCGVFHIPDPGLTYPWLALCCLLIVLVSAFVAILGNILTGRLLSETIPKKYHLLKTSAQGLKRWKREAIAALVVATGLFCVSFVGPLEGALERENRVLTYWRAMHLASGVSPIVPILSILVALYLSFWFKLHGLALFGPDRPRLPLKRQLALEIGDQTKYFLRMFSQQDAARKIEDRVNPLNQKTVVTGLVFFVLFFFLPCVIAGGVPIRSLGAESYSIIFLLGLDLCCGLALVETWRLYEAWEELRRLLEFLDRLALRRTLAVLHGFSWGSVWKMSGNVLEVRYKVISRQMECMNHTIASLEAFGKRTSDPAEIAGIQSSLDALAKMRDAGMKFADWYCTNYTVPRAGDLTSFRDFQKSIAAASGTLLTKLLVPEWRKEQGSLLAAPLKEEKTEATPNPPRQAKEEHIRNAEEFVCLNYLAFVQNVLGRLRTMAITIVVLVLAATVATSTYPFDPRQALSIVLIVLFVITGVVIVKVYAEMHRDATLSHVTNTKPGELGVEFWFKIVGFGFAPLLGLLTRVVPGIADFVFAWLQPGISSIK
jgi:hypothetical protein